ncbi:hypothetical protein AB0I28_12045 [Phytomonospora sp. NPDC050363]|uniref:hypothetical protein n=1 Tax=Phytomonospora sp. NPDC050363 TaxID=3155642 RepID=UPI003401D175
MSRIEEVISALQQVVDRVGEAQQATALALSATGEALTGAQELGAANTVSGLDAVRALIESLQGQADGLKDAAEDAISRTHAVAGGS